MRDMDEASLPIETAEPRESASEPVASSREVEDALLAALASMAVRSHRRQADLGVATRRAALSMGADKLQLALLRLQEDGCIDSIVPLTDGGVLLSVTSRGIERLSLTSRRYVVSGD